jgi:hypothetical protein
VFGADLLTNVLKLIALKVDIDVEAGTVAVWNNGKGVPVEIHKDHDMYVPELIFGELLASENYDVSYSPHLSLDIILSWINRMKKIVQQVVVTVMVLN